MLKFSQCFFFWKSDLAAFTYSYCCLQMNYSCIWFHFFSAAGLILDTIFLHSRKLWLCLDFPTFPFSTELAGFIKKVRNKNKTSLSGLSIDEIAQRVTEHILDEERKKKVSVSFKFIIYSTFFLFIYKMWELWGKTLPTKDGEQCSRQCSRFWVTELASLLYILAAAKSRKGPEAVCTQLCCCCTQGRPGPTLHACRSIARNQGAEDRGHPCECCVHDCGVPSVLWRAGRKQLLVHDVASCFSFLDGLSLSFR